jgi:hypothetical protein
MKQRKFVLPPHITEKLEEIQKSCDLTCATNAEATARVASDDLVAIAATERVFALELIDLLGRAHQVVEDVKILVVNSRPPINAEYVLHVVLGKEEREAVIGDLVQEYGCIMLRFGQRHADIWFYKQVILSVWPFLRRAVARAAAFLWLGRLLRQLIS